MLKGLESGRLPRARHRQLRLLKYRRPGVFILRRHPNHRPAPPMRVVGDRACPERLLGVDRHGKRFNILPVAVAIHHQHRESDVDRGIGKIGLQRLHRRQAVNFLERIRRVAELPVKIGDFHTLTEQRIARRVHRFAYTHAVDCGLYHLRDALREQLQRAVHLHLVAREVPRPFPLCRRIFLTQIHDARSLPDIQKCRGCFGNEARNKQETNSTGKPLADMALALVGTI